jgi:hypothetical protein
MGCPANSGRVSLFWAIWDEVQLMTLNRADRPMLRIPKSFVQLQDLNTLLKKYRDVYPYRIFGTFIAPIHRPPLR